MIDGIELKIMRIRKGIKGKQMASYLKVSNAYISMVESNKEKPSEDTYKKWIAILKGDEGNNN